ncbi:hypothetical protein [Brevibacterium samyangense]|uniref:Uncharacterized protein n=1 Tax=Brevibacterium samyangense TaxID=366888 RepID=A0ABP5F184_9MICO
MKEKEAADAAVAALEEYIAVSNEVFSAGGEGAEKFKDVASDAVLLQSQADAGQLESEGWRFDGGITNYGYDVTEVDLKEGAESPISYVRLQACYSESAFSLVDTHGDAVGTPAPNDPTFEYVIGNYDEQWLVSEQNLVSNYCS